MTSYCGYIALIGRPNVGKSTLLNRILQQKLSITSRKPQTTRHSILGIQTHNEYQFVYVDTPGIHQGTSKTINCLMNKTAMRALRDVDVIVFIIDSNHWKEEDEFVLGLITEVKTPCILVINKVDKITQKEQLLPWIDQLSQRYAFTTIVPISAKTGLQIDKLESLLKTFLPPGPHLFEPDQLTDRSTQFLCAELLREKIFRLCGEEIPYATTVHIESFQDKGSIVHIHAIILVDKNNHKRIIIGDKGQKLKDIATDARLNMEQLLDKKVFLQCWCKVKSGWSNNEHLLKQLGYDG